jgi:hypothetical protein
MSVNSEHNYIRKIAELHRRGAIPEGRAGEAEVRHDDWCAMLVQGGRCDCDPDIIVRLLPDPRHDKLRHDDI